MKLKKEIKSEENSDCICPEVDCERHGKCIECQSYHHKNKEKSYCGE
jgi:hypothetical protein